MKFDVNKDLNKVQNEAVCCVNGPSIILAGAGSGKTRVLTTKVLHLIHNMHIDPSSILMVTFTNKAAGEMKERVSQKLGFIGTFHSLCARILRKEWPLIGLSHNFVIFDDNDSESLIKDILKELKPEKTITPAYIASKISSAKDNLINAQKYKKFVRSTRDEIVSKVYIKYQKRLEKSNAVDFDDLIFKTVMLFKKEKKILYKYQKQFKYILIDEYHDTNFAQYMLSRYLAKKHNNITVVGDFSQSIYSWRGADMRNLEKFQKDFPKAKTFYLEQNYRSTQKILDFAFGVIESNTSHPVLRLFTQNDEGDDVEIKMLSNEQEEAIYIAEQAEKIAETESIESIAVLYRINAQSRIIEEALLHFGIPYILIGGTRFYERKEIKDILSYIRLVINPKDEVSEKRAIKIGKRRFEKFKKYCENIKGKEKDISTEEIINGLLSETGYLQLYHEDDVGDLSRLENIKELKSVAQSFPRIQEFLEQIALVESEYSESEKKRKNKKGVHLMTLHQAKGLEFPYVFIVGVEEGILPHSRSIYDQMQIEEERRLFYVGVTRAKKRLTITYARKRFLFGRRVPAEPSRFIEDKVEDNLYTKTF